MIIVFAIIAYIICAILCGAIVQYCDKVADAYTDDSLMRAMCILWPVTLLITIYVAVTETGMAISRIIGNWLFTIFHNKS